MIIITTSPETRCVSRRIMLLENAWEHTYAVTTQYLVQGRAVWIAFTCDTFMEWYILNQKTSVLVWEDVCNADSAPVWFQAGKDLTVWGPICSVSWWAWELPQQVAHWAPDSPWLRETISVTFNRHITLNRSDCDYGAKDVYRYTWQIKGVTISFGMACHSWVDHTRLIPGDLSSTLGHGFPVLTPNIFWQCDLTWPSQLLLQESSSGGCFVCTFLTKTAQISKARKWVLFSLFLPPL